MTANPARLTAAEDQVQPTPFPEANAILREILPAVQAELGEKLVGLYLYGSAAHGGFDPGLSDVDLLAAVATDLDGREFDRLRRMHAHLAATSPEWADRIEVQYLPLLALRTFKTQARTVPVISPGEPFHWREVDNAWTMNWYDVRENGITLAGPDPRTLIDPVSQDEFVASVRGHAEEWRTYINRIPRTRGPLAYAVLTMCRALHTCGTGNQVSKSAAARWAQAALPEWAPVIERALEWRRDSPRHAEPVDDAGFQTASDFIDFVIDRVRTQ